MERGAVELVVQPGDNEVDLAEARLVRTSSDAGEMLHGDASLGVVFDAEASKQADLGPGLLAGLMSTIAADQDNGCGHGRSTSGSKATMISCSRSGKS